MRCAFAAKAAQIKSSDNPTHQIAFRLTYQTVFRNRLVAEIGRKVALFRSSIVPSWLAPAEIRVSKRELRVAAYLKRSLQRNWHEKAYYADGVRELSPYCRKVT